MAQPPGGQCPLCAAQPEAGGLGCRMKPEMLAALDAEVQRDLAAEELLLPEGMEAGPGLGASTGTGTNGMEASEQPHGLPGTGRETGPPLPALCVAVLTLEDRFRRNCGSLCVCVQQAACSALCTCSTHQMAQAHLGTRGTACEAAVGGAGGRGSQTLPHAQGTQAAMHSSASTSSHICDL